MSFFPTLPLFAGIDMREGSTLTALLRKTRKGWEVIHLRTYAKTESVKPVDTCLVISALPARDTLVRTSEIQVKNEKDIRNALKFQIEPQLPYPIERALLQFQILEKKENKTSLTLFAVRNDHLIKHLEQLKERGLEPQRVTSVPAALTALTTLFPPAHSPQFLVHEGEEEVTCILVEEGKLLASRAFESTLDIGTEVQKTLLSFSSSLKGKTFETILFLGKRVEEIKKATQKKVSIPETPSLLLSQEEVIRYGLAIGIALASDKSNFQQSAPYKWARLKKPLFTTAVLSLFLIGTLIALAFSSQKMQKDSVKRAYIALLEREGKEETDLPASVSDYFNRLNALEKEIEARPDTFPLHPEIPKVREVIAWLATYEEIAIESLHYLMVKRPSFSDKNEPYKIKIELELTAKGHQGATHFHDALHSPNLFVDPEEEIQWIPGKGRYRTIFYLKDKTRYV